MSKQEWKENKGRRPFPVDVRVDVVLRKGNGERHSGDRRCGDLDWSIEQKDGDILRYIKVEE